MPHTRSAGFQPRSRAMASCTCTPRLLPSNSCHSSATTSCTLASVSRASARASSSDRLSGVVTSTVGRRRNCALRSPLAVSPVRAPAVQRDSTGCSGASASSGACRARSVSAASARMGVSHSTVSGSGVGRRVFAMVSIATCARISSAAARFDLDFTAGRASANACNAPSQTAYVLPAPVVACSRPLCPALIARQTSRWKANGFQPPSANHWAMSCLAVTVGPLRSRFQAKSASSAHPSSASSY